MYSFKFGVVTHWDRENILDAIDYFYKKNNRLPNTDELLASNLLPYKEIIKKYLKNTPSVAMHEIYADRKLPEYTRLEALHYAWKVTQNKDVNKI